MHNYVIGLVGIRQRRIELALTQDQLARLANISVQSLGKLERGQSKARVSTVARLAKALACKPKDLITPLT